MLNAIRNRPGARPAAATKPPSGAGIVVVTSRKSAASSTVLAIGPFTLNPFHASSCGASGTRSRCGLIPNSPHHVDGIRIDPMPSEPRAIDARPAATAAPLPPLLPPGRVVGVPRVARRTERDGFGERPQHHLGHRGLADDDCARRAQPPHHLGVVGLGGPVGGGAVCRHLAGDVDVVLDRDRHAEQRQPLTRVEPGLRRGRLLAARSRPARRGRPAVRGSSRAMRSRYSVEQRGRGDRCPRRAAGPVPRRRRRRGRWGPLAAA